MTPDDASRERAPVGPMFEGPQSLCFTSVRPLERSVEPQCTKTPERQKPASSVLTHAGGGLLYILGCSLRSCLSRLRSRLRESVAVAPQLVLFPQTCESGVTLKSSSLSGFPCAGRTWRLRSKLFSARRVDNEDLRPTGRECCRDRRILPRLWIRVPIRHLGQHAVQSGR